MMRLVLCAVLAAALAVPATLRAYSIPPDVQDIVTFVFVKDDAGNLVPNGTAFFLAVPEAPDGKLEYIYMVSAGHVLRDAAGALLPKVWVRLNRKGGDSDVLELDLASLKTKQLLEPADPTVDLIAVLWAPPVETYDYRHIHLELLPGADVAKELEVGAGTDVFFTGLFTSYFGQKRNVSVSHFGRVALLPSERIPIGARPDGTEDRRELYLMEAQANGGNSGSPVFFYLPASGAQEPRIRLAGVLSCTFLNLQALSVSGATSVSASSLGIAGVVPAHLLRELLTSEVAKKQRVQLAPATVSPSPK